MSCFTFTIFIPTACALTTLSSGSVPLFWEQRLIKGRHEPELSRTKEASAPAFNKHISMVLQGTFLHPPVSFLLWWRRRCNTKAIHEMEAPVGCFCHQKLIFLLEWKQLHIVDLLDGKKREGVISQTYQDQTLLSPALKSGPSPSFPSFSRT